MNNRRTIMSSSSVNRNVRTNVGLNQWFQTSSSKCVPMNQILDYQSNKNRILTLNIRLCFFFVLVNGDLGLFRT